MKINQIIVLKETRENEGRVALTPTAVKKLIEKNYVILVESGAGALAGFSDEEYIKAGADVFEFGKKSFPSHSLFLRVKRPTLEREALENKLISNDSAMLGFLDPFDINQESHLVRWKNLGLKIIDLELLPLAANDPKNPLAAMSQIAGELALEDALDKYQGDFPKKVTVIGTGSAGLAAVRAARKLKLPVQLFGRKEQYKKIADELGATYHLLPATNQIEFIRQYLSDQTIVVAAARVVGEKSPLLIDSASLAVLPDNTIIVDLSAGEGSSVVGSHQDAVIKAERGILIVNVSGYPKARPKLASEGFAERMVNLLLELMPAESRIDLNHPILKQI